jgi:hypothetical protein
MELFLNQAPLTDKFTVGRLVLWMSVKYHRPVGRPGQQLCLLLPAIRKNKTRQEYLKVIFTHIVYYYYLFICLFILTANGF